MRLRARRWQRRAGASPAILEMETYRYRGHSMSDPAKYRTREEVNRMRRDRDPIERLRHVLESEGHADADALKAIDGEIREIVADAAAIRRAEPGTGSLRAPHRRPAGGMTPMPVAVTMPALSPTMTEGTLAKWLVSEGDRVSPGDVIAEIETDKATMEVEAVDEGTVASLVVPEGTEGIEVNATILLLAWRGRKRGRGAGSRRRLERAAGPARSTEAGAAETPPPCACARVRTGLPGRDGRSDRARGAARRHGRGDAPRRGQSS